MPDHASGDESAPVGEDDLRSLVARARGSGDAGAAAALRAAFDADPRLWEAYGDLAAHARSAWIALAARDDPTLADALRRRARAMLNELAGPGAPALERLLAERVVSTWLEAHYADATAARAGELSLKQAAFATRRQESAHRRHLSAIGALATLRRLLPATAEVVVAAGDDAPPDGECDAPGVIALGAASSADGRGPAHGPVDPFQRPFVRPISVARDGAGIAPSIGPGEGGRDHGLEGVEAAAG